MSSDFLIKAEGVSKKYCRDLRRSLRYGLQDLFHEVIRKPRSTELRPLEFWSLRDVSFELGRGEAIALLGRNGAGKSTLLQLLNGRLKLDEGRVTVRGKTGLVTELGAGFNPVQTGRENVHNSAAVLGLSRDQIDSLYGDIVEFAELGEVMETPVQTYSTGMRARLGFSVIAHLRPDVLLGDEVLTVGDLGFRRKCVKHMKRYQNEGGTLILVAHDTYYLQSIATRCMILDQGQVIFDGPAQEGFAAYFDLLRMSSAEIGRASQIISAELGESEETRQGTDGAESGVEEEPSATVRREDPTEEKPAVIDHVHVRGENGDGVQLGKDAIVEIRYRALRVIENVYLGFSIHTADMSARISVGFNGLEGERRLALPEGEGKWCCRIKSIPLAGGRYAISAAIVDFESKLPLAELGREDAAIEFQVEAEPTRSNTIRSYLETVLVLETEWESG